MTELYTHRVSAGSVNKKLASDFGADYIYIHWIHNSDTQAKGVTLWDQNDVSGSSSQYSSISVGGSSSVDFGDHPLKVKAFQCGDTDMFVSFDLGNDR